MTDELKTTFYVVVKGSKAYSGHYNGALAKRLTKIKTDAGQG
jgi:hypothetical protein